MKTTIQTLIMAGILVLGLSAEAIPPYTDTFYRDRTLLIVTTDHGRDGVDEPDDQFRHGIAGRCLPAEEKGARLDVKLRILSQPVIQGDDVQHIQVLALVLVNPLDLDIEQHVGWQRNAGLQFDVAGEALLVGELDRAPLFLEGLVIDVRLEAAQLLQFSRPAVADLCADRLREIAARRSASGTPNRAAICASVSSVCTV